MAHAELTEVVGGEVAQPPRRRSLLASIEHALGVLVEIPAALLVVAEIVILFAGVVARYGVAPAADLVGRTGLDPVPVARHAGRRGRVPPRRAHADDGGGRQRPARHARLSRSGRDLRPRWRSYSDRLAGLRIRLRGKLHHDAGAADRQYLARRGAAGRYRPDGAVCVPAAGCGPAMSAPCSARSCRSRW